MTSSMIEPWETDWSAREVQRVLDELAECKEKLERFRYLLTEASLLVRSTNREFSAQVDAALTEEK